jgi:hypothetical protein
MDEVEQVLADLSSQAEVAFRRERSLEVAERSRHAYRAVSMVDRLLASVGETVRCELPHHGSVSGELRDVGVDWLWITESSSDAVVMVPAVAAIAGLSPRARHPLTHPITARRSVASPLRAFVEQGRALSFYHQSGGVRQGTLARIGADFMELATPSEVLALRVAHLSFIRAR